MKGIFLFLGLVSLPGAVAAQTTEPPARPGAAMVENLAAFEKAQTATDAPLLKLADAAKFTGTFGIDKPHILRVFNFGSSLPKQDRIDAWRWASVTKQVVAVLMMQEVAKGMIDLDQPISRYLPKFGGSGSAKISVRQLLRHQSGLPNPDDTATSEGTLAAYYAPKYQGNRNPLTGYCAGPPKGPSGGSWAYNNCDYIVAGALLEAVTGQSWAKLVEQRIAKPLGLTSVRAFKGKVKTRVGSIKGSAEPEIDFAAFGASAGLYGTAEDLLRFDRALMSGKLLPAAQLKALWDGKPDLGFIALGQWVFEAPLNGCATPVKLVERRGAIGGVQVRNFLAPDLNSAAVVFSDKAEGDFEFGEIWQGSGFAYDLLSLAFCSPKPDAK